MRDCQRRRFNQIDHDGDQVLLPFDDFRARVAAIFFRLHFLVHRASRHFCMTARLCFLKEREALQFALAKMEIDAEGQRGHQHQPGERCGSKNFHPSKVRFYLEFIRKKSSS